MSIDPPQELPTLPVEAPEQLAPALASISAEPICLTGSGLFIDAMVCMIVGTIAAIVIVIEISLLKLKNFVRGKI